MKIIITVIFMLNLFFPWTAFQLEGKIKINPSRIFADYRFLSVDKIVKYKKKYFVLETKNHRILVFDESMKKIGQVSEIGQGKGELFYPENLIIKKGLIYVLDNNRIGYCRIQVLDLKGVCLNEFSVNSKAYGFDVNSRGEIYLGLPENENLISVYNKTGEKIAAFGKLKKASSFYGANFKNIDKDYKTAINRINLYIDRLDNVYLSFVGAAFIQKYNNRGELIFEKELISPETGIIKKGFKEERAAPVTKGIDRFPTPFITTGITVDENSGNIIVHFQWYRGWLYIADRNGDKITILEPIDRSMLFHNITITDDANLLLPRLSSISYNQAFMINIKEILLNKGGHKK